MSHIIWIRTETRDAEAQPLSCDRLQLKRSAIERRNGSVPRRPATASRWRYSIVCDVESGRVPIDNLNGRRGKQRELNRLLQTFSIDEDATGIKTARAYGHSAIAQPARHQFRLIRRRALVRRLQLQF